MKDKKDPMTIMSWITQMCNLISNHGLWKIFISVLTIGFSIIIINIAFNPSKVFETWDKYMSKKHTEGVNYRIEIDPKINRILTSIQDELCASRAFIMEPHNGTQSLNGIPFWYLNMTQEVVAEDVYEVKRHYNDIEANDFPFAYLIYQEHEWSGTIDELKIIDKRLAKLMYANDAKYLTVVSMHGVDNFLGFIGVSFIDNGYIPDQRKVDIVLHNAAQKIGNLLDGYEKK